MSYRLSLFCMCIAFSSLGARASFDFDEAVSPCFELYNMGRCFKADFDGAIQCIDNLDSRSLSYGDRMGLNSIRSMLQRRQQQCHDWIYGPNPVLNVVLEPCDELYSRGRCESARFDEAIQCVQNIKDSGRFHSAEDMNGLNDYLRVYRVYRERCREQ